MSTITEICEICGQAQWLPLYEGPIRMGRFGQWSPGPVAVWRCAVCRAGRLDVAALDYASSYYRNSVDGDDSAETYFRLHDKDQLANLCMLGTDGLRGKVVADIGCGAGSFLDLVKGPAAATIAIEPNPTYQATLRQHGHHCFAYPGDALATWESQVDLAVSFAVIEHVPDPLCFLSQIRSLLKPGARLLLSTPNADDWLVGFHPDYARFFYRRAHKWYFNRDSLQFLAEKAGFSDMNCHFRQRFDLANAFYWLREGRPTGLAKLPLFQNCDAGYRQCLEDHGVSDFIFASLHAAPRDS